MMLNDNTLFIIICSNTKRRGGERHYAAGSGLAAALPDNLARDLLQTRRAVLDFIRQDGEKRDDVLLLDLPRNQNLLAGPDLGGRDAAGEYLPAVSRYSGSFYRALGPDAAQVLGASRYPVLVLSGLYGLLRANELIQDYSCHIDDHPGIRPAWTDDGRLTGFLRAYLKAHGLTRVFDFTALAGYRQLVNWNSLTQRGVQVWHAFGRQTVGDGLLTPLGELLGRWLRHPESVEMEAVASGKLGVVSTETEVIHFSQSVEPPAGFPREASRRHQLAASKDEMVRLARGLKHLLAHLADNRSMESPGADIEKLKRQGRLDEDVARAMHSVIRRRNLVEHDARAWITAGNLEQQRADFRRVWKWAQQNDLVQYLEQECTEP